MAITMLSEGGLSGPKYRRLHPGSGLVVVQHGADGTVARPDALVVYWLGAATPVNAKPYDLHYTGTI